jgi:ribosome-associated protein
MKRNDPRAEVAIAVNACLEKKAQDVSILHLDPSASGLTDYLVICSGANPRQVEAIAEGVDEALSKAGQEPSRVDGRKSENWVVLDYGDFMVHVFSESARKFYDLERLWKTATHVEPADLTKPEPKKIPVKRASGAKTGARPAARKTARQAATKRRKGS